MTVDAISPTRRTTRGIADTHTSHVPQLRTRPSSFAEGRARLLTRIVSGVARMTEHLHERKPMATNTLIGFAGVALTFAGVALTILALIGTCIVAYGAWSRSEGERTAYEHVTSDQLRTLQSAKDSTVVELAVLKQADATRDHTHEVLGNKIDEYRAYVQALTIKMTQAGVRDIPSPPK